MEKIRRDEERVSLARVVSRAGAAWKQKVCARPFCCWQALNAFGSLLQQRERPTRMREGLKGPSKTQETKIQEESLGDEERTEQKTRTYTNMFSSFSLIQKGNGVLLNNLAAMSWTEMRRVRYRSRDLEEAPEI